MSTHPDCCTPAEFFDSVKLRILIFKIIKGRSKTVQFGTEECKADSSFNSHIPLFKTDLHNEPPQIRFRHSQVTS